MSSEFAELFDRGNPEAIDSCDLNLALLTPNREDSAGIIERYKSKFGPAIEAELAKSRQVLYKIDRSVDSLLRANNERAGVQALGGPRTSGTELIALCAQFSTKLSALRELANLEGTNE